VAGFVEEPKSGAHGWVQRSIEPLINRNADTMERRDTTGNVSGRMPFAEIGCRPGEVGSTVLLGASREGEDAIEVRICCDVQVRWRVCDLIEDVGLAEVE